MKLLLVVLLALLALLQYRLWLAEGGIAEAVRLQERIAEEQAINAELKARNDALATQVMELQRSGVMPPLNSGHVKTSPSAAVSFSFSSLAAGGKSALSIAGSYSGNCKDARSMISTLAPCSSKAAMAFSKSMRL